MTQVHFVTVGQSVEESYVDRQAHTMVRHEDCLCLAPTVFSVKNTENAGNNNIVPGANPCVL